MAKKQKRTDDRTILKVGALPDRIVKAMEESLRRDKITAPVTEQPPAKDPYDFSDFPDMPEMFLRNPDNTFKWKSPTTVAPKTSAPATASAPSAASPGGETSGMPSSMPSGSPGGGFDQYRVVSPDEINTKIKQEADRRWREWMPTKTDRKRPRLSTYVRQVRKEYYP